MFLSFSGPLDLEATLYSGQAFRWQEEGGGRHVGFIRNGPVQVYAGDRGLHVRSLDPLDETEVRRYFRLDASHDEFLAGAPQDPMLRAALDRFPGLRLLRQDPWEILVSFVLSQNSNEAKIRRTIETLSEKAGAPVEWEGRRSRRFPTPEALARLTQAELRATGMGYRAPYVAAVARAVADGDLEPERLPRMPYEEAFEALLALPGIGEKVADCVLLYGCDHGRAFPSDVWVRRLVRESYLRRKRPSYARLRELAWKRFGPHCGYAQHYLFHYRRSVGTLSAKPAK